jgi:hypothetical protein
MSGTKLKIAAEQIGCAYPVLYSADQAVDEDVDVYERCHLFSSV